MRTILAFGASSAIVEAYLKAESRQSYQKSQPLQVFFLGRSLEKLQIIANDLKIRYGIETHCKSFDPVNFKTHEPTVRDLFSQVSSVDVAIVGFGTMGDQTEQEQNFEQAVKLFELNTVATIGLVNALAKSFLGQKYGKIAVITSVAGDRGRAKNAFYGASKAAVSTYLSGLAQKLSKNRIQVVDIKPGPVLSPMTAHLESEMNLAKPEPVGRDIYEALQPHKGSGVLYTPGKWRWIMLIIGLIPGWVFNRLDF